MTALAQVPGLGEGIIRDGCELSPGPLPIFGLK